MSSTLWICRFVGAALVGVSVFVASLDALAGCNGVSCSNMCLYNPRRGSCPVGNSCNQNYGPSCNTCVCTLNATALTCECK